MAGDYKSVKKGALQGLKAYGRSKLGEDLKGGLSGPNEGDTLNGEPIVEGGDERAKARVGMLQESSEAMLPPPSAESERVEPLNSKELSKQVSGGGIQGGLDTSEKTMDVGAVGLPAEPSPVPGVEDAALDNLPPEEIERLLASLGGQ